MPRSPPKERLARFIECLKPFRDCIKCATTQERRKKLKTCKTCKEIKENREIFKGLPNEEQKMTNVAKVKITIRTYDRMNRKKGK